MLIATLFPRIIASYFNLHFKSPVYIEDEFVVEVQATMVRENKSRYIVKFLTKCFKNDNLLVIDREAMMILPTLAMENVDFVE
uniref:Thioesterase domain-containing protein n=1 Tax=Populus trichocarpa TaxID=3694 RepID=A0A2K1XCM0_POPTR